MKMTGNSNEVMQWNPWSKDLPGAASLLEHIDKRIFVWLRDGRMYVGLLRSVDQFANLVMSEASLRIIIGKEFGDIPHGIFMVRGENVSLLGEEKSHIAKNMLAAGAEEMLAAQAVQDNRQKKKENLKMLAYWKRGLIFTPEDYF